MATIRSATVADAYPISLVHVRSWRHAYAGIMPEDVLAALDVDQWARRRRARLEQPADTRAEVRVACAGSGRVIGFTMSGAYREDQGQQRLDQRFGEVYGIYLDPDVLGTGVGRALMDDATARLVARGWTEIRLWVLAANVRARRFYERYGFAADGATARYPLRRPNGDTVELLEVRYTLVGSAAPPAAGST